VAIKLKGLKMKAIRFLLLALALLVNLQLAKAQQYPDHAIRLVTGSGAGGTTDAYTRAVASQVSASLGQPVVVENLPGAGGVIGTRRLAQSKPDGYTVGFVTNSYVTHQLTSKNPQYRWPDDFILVHRGTDVQMGLAASTKSPFKTLKELVAYAKAHPGAVKAGNLGQGNTAEILSKQFQSLTGVVFNDVSYKTAADMMRSLMSGETDLDFTTSSLYQPGVEAGSVRVLAMLNDQRDPSSPDVPTLKENGIDEVYRIFQGFAFPKSVPQEIVNRWFVEIDKANKSDLVRKMIDNQKLIVETGSREEMEKKTNRELVQFEQIMKAANLEPQ
jgi:tripartite-type tricarboxylate transporter receptor subunit TctC